MVHAACELIFVVNLSKNGSSASLVKKIRYFVKYLGHYIFQANCLIQLNDQFNKEFYMPHISGNNASADYQEVA